MLYAQESVISLKGGSPHRIVDMFWEGNALIGKPNWVTEIVCWSAPEPLIVTVAERGVFDGLTAAVKTSKSLSEPEPLLDVNHVSEHETVQLVLETISRLALLFAKELA